MHPLVLTAVMIALFGGSPPNGMALEAPTAPRTLIVALDGSGHYRSIQEAVDAAGNGDTVEIRAGEYYEDVTIHSKQHLRLVGEARDRVKVMGRNRVGAFHIGKWPYGANDIVVSELTVNSHGGLAMGIFNGKDLILKHLRINGLLFSQQATGVRIEDCLLGDSETTGVAFAESEASLVANLIHDNDHGVTVAGKSDVRLERNVITRNLYEGVIVADRSHAALVSNTIVKNAGGVAFVDRSLGELTGNIIGLNRIGLRLEGSAEARLSYNAVYNTEQDYVHAPDRDHATDVRADPRFVDAMADDFRLKADSPLTKRGAFSYLGALPPITGP